MVAVAVVAVLGGLLLAVSPAGVSAASGPTSPGQAAALVPSDLPQVRNRSSLTDARATELAAAALAGLGFAPGDATGPQAGDRVVVTDDFVAWIDETGFYGKLNGLWWLSPTVSGDRWFTLTDAGSRPVNQLVVGEAGDGAWPKGYRGGEHIEMPNNVPEANDGPGCATPNSWCSQFSLDEAPAITRPGLPWWSACGAGTLGWADHVNPIEVTETPTSVRLVYEARLVKMADGGGPPYDPTHCHEDWLFPDGVRRPVYLRVGYELHTDGPAVDRLMQVRNPAGNPDFAGPFSFIGGFVLTRWPSPYPGKELNTRVRPETNDVWAASVSRTLVGGQWNEGFPSVAGPDVVFGWLGQPISLGTVGAFERGRALRLSHLGPKDNLDTGICLCVKHGAIEMGGGLLHSAPATDAALPIAGGTSSIEARRRLETGPASVIADPPASTTSSTSSTVVSTSNAGPSTTTVTGSTVAAAVAVTPAYAG